MTKTTLRKKIVDCVEHINDEKILEAVYTLLNGQVSNDDYEFNEEEKKELDSLRKQHKSGKSKSYTVAEVRKHAYSKLKK